MDTVLLTLRWQNILSIWIIIILLGFVSAGIAMFVRSNASNSGG